MKLNHVQLDWASVEAVAGNKFSQEAFIFLQCGSNLGLTEFECGAMPATTRVWMQDAACK